MSQRARHRGTLSLAYRDFRRTAAEQGADPEFMRHCPQKIRVGTAENALWQGDVLAKGQERQQSRGLGHEADTFAAQCGQFIHAASAPQIRRVDATQHQRIGVVRPQRQRQQAEQGALPTTGRSNDGNLRAARQLDLLHQQSEAGPASFEGAAHAARPEHRRPTGGCDHLLPCSGGSRLVMARPRSARDIPPR
jgi:hypothetical protein